MILQSRMNSIVNKVCLTISHGKVTLAVCQILQSQKTFANYLSNAKALAALLASQHQLRPVAALPTLVSRALPASTSTLVALEKIPRKRSLQKKKRLNAKAASTPLRKVSTLNPRSTTPSLTPLKSIKTETSNNNVVIIDLLNELLAPLLALYKLTRHPRDKDPLLISHIPPLLLQAELEILIATLPLTYIEAKGELTDKDLRKPTRSFCEICKY